MFQFLNPLSFLLTLFIALVVLFYFFRKQYEEKIIPSNMLWREAMNEWQASPFLKKLQHNLLFWLQIFALLFLMLALAQPHFFQEKLKGEHVVLIIDTSATMSAKDGELTRFARAKEEMKELAKALDGQEVSLIEAGEKPKIILNREKSKKNVLQAIEELKLSYEHENMEKALNLAQSISSQTDTAWYVFTDQLTKEMVKEEKHYVEVRNMGEKLENISLSSFAVGQIDGEIRAVAVIENQTNQEQTVVINLTAGGESITTQETVVEKQDSSVVTFSALPDKPYYEASLAVEDGYPADNKAASVYTDATPKIYALGEVNPFVIKAFETIGVELIQKSETLNDRDPSGIVIMEGMSVDVLPNQPAILFNTNERVALSKSVTSQKDPLLDYVHPEKMFISHGRKALDEKGLEPVLSSGSQHLIKKGIINGLPLVVVNFSIADSDWPLHPDFPIFLYNSYQWLAQQRGFLGYFHPSEEKWLQVSNAHPILEIYNDKDESLYAIDTEKEPMKAPVLPGTYQAVSDEEIYYFSVLLDEREKAPLASPSFILEGEKDEEKERTREGNDSLILLLSFLALFVIMVEWEVYRRGVRT